jgi:hypothetical protein
MERQRGGDQCTNVLVLEECSTECDWVVGTCVCASTKASGDTVDGKTGFDLGSDDVTRSIVSGTELF